MVWTALHASIHKTLRQRQLLTKGQAIVLGFSAGQDSMCLLQVLRDLQPQWCWRLVIAHCNHRWPLDADRNAAHVAQLAKDWNLDYYSFTAPQVLRGEAEGRLWRYQVLAELAETERLSAVLTAHTASDRAETVLLNLLRGSGMDGLQALVWKRALTDRVQLIRPLLNITREQTGTFCAHLHLPIWEDVMNTDPTYRRNRTRLELLPLLRQRFNPQAEMALARTAEILQAETAYLEEQAAALLTQAALSTSPCSPPLLAALDQTVLQQSPLALQRRALRQWLRCNLNLQPTFGQVEKTVMLLAGNNGDRTDPFVRNIVAEVQRPWICLRPLDKPILHPTEL